VVTARDGVRWVLSGLTSHGGILGEAVALELLARLPGLSRSIGRLPRSVHGLSWSLDLADNLQRQLYFTGAYDLPTLRIVCTALRPDDVVLDVGANIGAFLLPVARALHELGGGGRVLGVEPASDTFVLLEDHVRRNGLDETVGLAHLAFGASVGTLELRGNASFDRNDVGTRSLHGSGPVVEEVQIVRGDDWLASSAIGAVDILKVDVEGAELEVLTGLDDLFSRPERPRLVVVEIVPRRFAPDDLARLMNIFVDRGYRGWWIRARGLEPIASDPGRSGNAVFVASGVSPGSMRRRRFRRTTTKTAAHENR
jgi:FkbM family methyltransferase